MDSKKFSCEQVLQRTQALLKSLQPKPEEMKASQAILLMREYKEIFENLYLQQVFDAADEAGKLNLLRFDESLQVESRGVSLFIANKRGLPRSSHPQLTKDPEYQELLSQQPYHQQIINHYQKYNADRSLYFKVLEYCSRARFIDSICPYFPGTKREVLEKIDVELEKVHTEDPVLNDTFKGFLASVKKLLEETDQEI